MVSSRVISRRTLITRGTAAPAGRSALPKPYVPWRAGTRMLS